ncbi:radial spoke head 1 homolog [Sycon ciliatum]|uniref:radial spoke head 1 homolog n=1 Tax=Sycon ciliatum TaxID=27933 RepID=UPI0031F6D24E
MPGKAKSRGKSTLARQDEPEPEPEPQLESGQLIYPSGERYDGQYLTLKGKAIERCGQGKFSYTDGTVFEGAWKKDKLSGDGTVQFPDGSSYKGGMDHLKFSGKGEYTFANGSKVSGQFQESRLQGDITFTDEQGQVWRGKINDAATERRPGQPTWTPTPPNAALLRKVLV